MAVHSFDLGDIVTIFQMSPGKGLMIEGPAAIVEIVDDVDEQYVVRFRNELDETYERFVGKGLQAGRGPSKEGTFRRYSESSFVVLANNPA